MFTKCLHADIATVIIHRMSANSKKWGLPILDPANSHKLKVCYCLRTHHRTLVQLLSSKDEIIEKSNSLVPELSNGKFA